MTKLNETNAMVEGLKGELTMLEPILEQASKDAEKLLKQVEIDKADAAQVKEKVTVCVNAFGACSCSNNRRQGVNKRCAYRT